MTEGAGITEGGGTNNESHRNREKKKELTETLREEDASARLEKLQRLAKQVGASVMRMERGRLITDSSGRITSEEMSRNAITETEIVQNIQGALQTETMIDMCKTAGRNFWIAVAAATIALFAMVAAWAATLIK
jgi:hypothetical protein